MHIFKGAHPMPTEFILAYWTERKRWSREQSITISMNNDGLRAKSNVRVYVIELIRVIIATIA